ncbi:AAA family ATPase [Legionella sp. km772]|uniref:AAA family ATPase n=1 Tax=Legionella sp. km772 TaxID=2498111 RepID=UPI000F8E9306|nr:AAA family ATPase [Legionella sp. km772]RUR05595.1 ATPase [Legionella sp. km772]
MGIVKKNYYLLTGGPGSGKSSVLHYLKIQSHRVVEEAARAILKEQKRRKGNATQFGDRAQFCQLMLRQSLEDFKTHLSCTEKIFFDRGLPDLLGYKSIANDARWTSIIEKVELANLEYRYNQEVFLFPPWQEIYTLDDERSHSFSQASQAYDLIKEALLEANYFPIEIPKVPIEERAQFILSKTQNVV